MNRYAGIIVDQAHSSIDRVFHYSIPAELEDTIDIGYRVSIPFGRYNRQIDGYVVQIDSSTEVPLDKIKSVSRILDTTPAILPRHIPMIKWMVDRYHCMTIEAIRCFVPLGLRINMKKQKDRFVYLVEGERVDERIIEIERRSAYMANILKFLKSRDGENINAIVEATSAPASSFKSLERRGWIEIDTRDKYRKLWNVSQVQKAIPDLTEAQQVVTDRAVEALNGNRYAAFLLHGVTGSGKTEVYIRIVDRAIKSGKQAIVLVPEISLTPQTVGRFKHRFGDQVAVLHSRLSEGERYDEWRRIMNGEANIAIGARSAVFAPFSNLGAIVVDEAHEDSYKSDLRPKYHAVEIAMKRCKTEGGILVLGTATPSIDDYYRSLKGDFELLELSRRVDGSVPPPVEIVDMREELMMGNRSMFSRAMYEGIDEILRRGQQGILLLNRRGYANFISCRECGWVAECRKCAVSLTYHASDKRLKCHYCGEQYTYPKICPRCKSRYIKQFGVGTQRLERELLKYFPKARIARMDMDTTSTKDAHGKILSSFENGEYDILLGTQMIAKGLDFPNVTLVGVVAADTSLNLPEYTSAERTFQLITQVGGRAGRGEYRGRVVVQTYQPDHYAILYAAKHDYVGFYNHEIELRRQFAYPPFAHIIKFLLVGEDEDRLIASSKELEIWLREKIGENPMLKEGLIQIGAYPAPISKINKRYRWQILIKIIDEKSYLYAYHGLIDMLLQCYNIFDENISVDFRPTSLL